MTQKQLTKITASAGTGKTFTLSAYYIAMLMLTGSYRSILAVTFTNKATTEMKTRILQYLYQLANGQCEQGFVKKLQQYLELFDCRKTEIEIGDLAKIYFPKMMADFDDIHITTIDSFLQVLMAGLAQTIGENAGFSVELEEEKIISKAIERLMSTTLLTNKDLQEALIGSLQDRLDKEQSWDIREQLRQLAKELFKETVQKREGNIIFDRKRIDAFRRDVDFRKSKDFQEAEKRIRLLNAHLSEILHNKNQSSYNKFIKGWNEWTRCNSVNEKCFPPLADKATAYLYTDKFEGSKEIKEALRYLVENRDDLVAKYKLWKLTTDHLDEMRLITFLRNEIEIILAEENMLLLNETAKTLTASLKTGDADFILEKAGLRYHHILLDEFQDTSALQWENFLPLIEEVLANGGTTLIVGDIKQSIYRFRNGDWTIMEGLNSQHNSLGKYIREEPLKRNFRSRKEIVDFNRQTFLKLTTAAPLDYDFYQSSFLDGDLSEYYREGAKDGGFIDLRFYPYTSVKTNLLQKDFVLDSVMNDMFAQVDNLLMRGETAEDILILVRTAENADIIVKKYNQLIIENPESRLKTISLATPKSFRLDSSEPVLLVIHTLRALLIGDEVSATWIRQMGYEKQLNQMRTKSIASMPLYTLVQETLNVMVCRDNNDASEEGQKQPYPAEGNGVEYINYLIDAVRAFVQKNGSDIKAFLAYWDEELCEKSIPTSAVGSIRIMTIHTSKGLEAKHLFVPFCDWNLVSDSTSGTSKINFLWCDSKLQSNDKNHDLSLVPLIFNSYLDQTAYQEEYDEECRQQQLDGLNILYVALTRAADNLFVSCPISMTTLKDRNRMTNAATLLADTWNMWDSVQQVFDDFDGSKKPDTTYFAQYTQGGDVCVVSSTHSDDGLFSFSNAHSITDVAFTSENDWLRFHATSESEREMQRLGNICHNIMAKVEVRTDVERVAKAFYRRGVITSRSQYDEVLQLIGRMWDEPLLCDWFSGKWQLLREDTFVQVLPDNQLQEKRMDRVMINPQTNDAIVLDYKFGLLDNKKYQKQVDQYKQILRDMGYNTVVGYLWKAQDSKLVRIE